MSNFEKCRQAAKREDLETVSKLLPLLTEEQRARIAFSLRHVAGKPTYKTFGDPTESMKRGLFTGERSKHHFRSEHWKMLVRRGG